MLHLEKPGGHPRGQLPHNQHLFVCSHTFLGTPPSLAAHIQDYIHMFKWLKDRQFHSFLAVVCIKTKVFQTLNILTNKL